MKNIFLTTSTTQPHDNHLNIPSSPFFPCSYFISLNCNSFFLRRTFFRNFISSLFGQTHIYTSTQHPKKIMCDPTSQLTYLLPSQKPDIKILTEHDIKSTKHTYTLKNEEKYRQVRLQHNKRIFCTLTPLSCTFFFSLFSSLSHFKWFTCLLHITSSELGWLTATSTKYTFKNPFLMHTHKLIYSAAQLYSAKPCMHASLSLSFFPFATLCIAIIISMHTRLFLGSIKDSSTFPFFPYFLMS